MGPFGFEPPTPPQDSIIQNECFEGAVSHIPESGCLPLCVAHLSQYGVPLDVIEQGIAKASQLGMSAKSRFIGRLRNRLDWNLALFIKIFSFTKIVAQ